MILETETFGPVLMMEVGAMMVGRIVNPPMYGQVHKGRRKAISNSEGPASSSAFRGADCSRMRICCGIRQRAEKQL